MRDAEHRTSMFPQLVGRQHFDKLLDRFNEPSRRLQDDDLIEILDITAPPQKEFFNPFRKPAPDLNDIKVDAGGKAHTFCFDGW